MESIEKGKAMDGTYRYQHSHSDDLNKTDKDREALVLQQKSIQFYRKRLLILNKTKSFIYKVCKLFGYHFMISYDMPKKQYPRHILLTPIINLYLWILLYTSKKIYEETNNIVVLIVPNKSEEFHLPDSVHLERI